MPVTLFTLYFIVCMVASNTTGQQCKPSEVSIPGKALNGHTFKATVVSGPIQCQMLCENDPKCRSYNFHILTKNCELNDETKETKPDDFDTDDLRFYMKPEDIGECKVFPFTCDVNTDCHNTDGSYICSCKAGYTGAGKTCTDIDECSTGKHNCSHVAVCNNTSGSYNCTCNEGYVGDGENCSDIDECLTGEHNCSHVAVCNNTIGSYNCTCQEGYIGDGRSCSDICECQEVPFPCAVKADCHNTEGSYICTCKAGYTGDGKTCTGYSGIVFTSQYKGQSILGTVGSSVTFSWSFSGGVSGIIWGKANPNNPLFIKTSLVYLSSTGSVSIPAPDSYSQRVSGLLVGNAFSGQAIFNISSIETKDSGIYTCVLYKGQKTKRDHVNLSVN
ncbi:protein kinase C-binding protein NELL2-like [Montipora foliosa]|uniref:protein kinase C-binding protein NELL2-like n=1 Tax=Montipora foliosa TaxID=591990 RepID=UPI0035F1061B